MDGAPFTAPPKDLYVPPDALKVFLEAFEGPLDLLLYLIKRQDIDILDIPIADITAQYMAYIDLMDELRLELAGEYLLMAAMLAEIKSRMLLPRPKAAEDEVDDPRAELIHRLQEYERYKQAACGLDALPRCERDTFNIMILPSAQKQEKVLPKVSLDALLLAFSKVLSRAAVRAHYHISRESLSVRERMTIILNKIDAQSFTEFTALFTVQEGRAGSVVTFLAILELVRASLIEAVQNEMDGPIYIKAA